MGDFTHDRRFDLQLRQIRGEGLDPEEELELQQLNRELEAISSKPESRPREVTEAVQMAKNLLEANK